MNYKETLQKFKSATQRLDHMVPSKILTEAANRIAMFELAEISTKLYELLPDPSLSPLERIERLARVCENTKPDLEQLQSAYDKVNVIKERLNELIPDLNLNVIDKIGLMVDKLHDLIPEEGKIIQKLELMGDPRVTEAEKIDLSPNLNAMTMAI